MKLKGSAESARSLSICLTVASKSSSQYGGLTSKDPETGLYSKNGLKKTTNYIEKILRNNLSVLYKSK